MWTRNCERIASGLGTRKPLGRIFIFIFIFIFWAGSIVFFFATAFPFPGRLFFLPEFFCFRFGFRDWKVLGTRFFLGGRGSLYGTPLWKQKRNKTQSLTWSRIHWQRRKYVEPVSFFFFFFFFFLNEFFDLIVVLLRTNGQYWWFGVVSYWSALSIFQTEPETQWPSPVFRWKKWKRLELTMEQQQQRKKEQRERLGTRGCSFGRTSFFDIDENVLWKWATESWKRTIQEISLQSDRTRSIVKRKKNVTRLIIKWSFLRMSTRVSLGQLRWL